MLNAAKYFKNEKKKLIELNLEIVHSCMYGTLLALVPLNIPSLLFHYL
jgi:hypothetical protein